MPPTNAESCVMTTLNACTTERRRASSCSWHSMHLWLCRLLLLKQHFVGVLQFTRLNAIYREEQKQKKNGGTEHGAHDSH